MTKKEKMKKWIEKNGDLIAGICWFAGSATLIAISMWHPKGKPHKHVMWYGDKQYRDDMHKWVNWANGHYDGGYIGWGLAADEVVQAVEETFGENHDDNLYRLIIHKVAKSNIET